MKRLWAPWRMQYIGSEPRPGCLFCRVIEHPDDPESLDRVRAQRRTLQVLRNTLKPDGFNVGSNLGNAAGAGIPDHVHIHIVPRWNGDTNFMAVIDDVKVVNEALAQTADKLKRAFA